MVFARTEQERFYRLLEDKVMESIRSGKFKHLEDCEKAEDWRKCAKTIQQAWLENYNKGRRLDIDAQHKQAEESKKTGDRLKKELTQAYENNNVELIKKKETEIKKHEERPRNRIEAYVTWLKRIGEWNRFLEIAKETWIETHPKFMQFCIELTNLLKNRFEERKGKEFFTEVDIMMKEIERFNLSRPGEGMKIYGPSDMLTGLSYCLSYANIDISMTADRRHLKFSIMR